MFKVLGLFTEKVYAQTATPTVIPVPAEGYQVLTNIMASVQQAIYDVITAILPYALPLMLLFLALGIGLALFNRFRH